MQQDCCHMVGFWMVGLSCFKMAFENLDQMAFENLDHRAFENLGYILSAFDITYEIWTSTGFRSLPYINTLCAHQNSLMFNNWFKKPCTFWVCCFKHTNIKHFLNILYWIPSATALCVLYFGWIEQLFWNKNESVNCKI